MPRRALKGYPDKQIYRVERFGRGVVSTNDPLSEGSFNSLVNFKISNNGTSIENRNPFLTIPFLDLNNREVKISQNSFLFTLNTDTEHGFILDMNQTIKSNPFRAIFLKKDITLNNQNLYVIDGDTFIVDDVRYRLAYIDTPELEDMTYKPIHNLEFKNMGQESKFFTQNFLKKSNTTISIIQFDFQSEKTDQFGREIVFVFRKEENNSYTLLNSELLKEGLAMFFNTNGFIKKEVEFFIPSTVSIEGTPFNFFNVFFNSYDKYHEEKRNHFAYGTIYTETKIKLLSFNSNAVSIYTKPIIHKFKKEIDLKKNSNGVFFKRIVSSFEVNETAIKKDLEKISDENLKYKLVNTEFTTVNGKYREQYINFHAEVSNNFGIPLYRGLMELTYSAADYDFGIKETFFFTTYKKPEVHTEIQDVINMKPNLYSDLSIIPETLMFERANVKGYNNPSVNAALLGIELDKKLETTFAKDDEKKMFYFNTNRMFFEDIEKFKLIPFFKAPEITGRKKQYMYRWDLVNLKEVDVSKDVDVEKAKLFFRTAWTKLNKNPFNPLINLSENSERKKKLAINKDSLLGVDELYMIQAFHTPTVISDDSELDLEFLYDKPTNPKKSLIELQSIFESYINNPNTELENIKALIKNGTTIDYASIFGIIPSQELPHFFEIDGYPFAIKKVKNVVDVLSKITRTNEKATLSLDQEVEQKNKFLTRAEVQEIFNQENKKIGFLFCPLDVKFEGTKINKKISVAWKTAGVTFDLNKPKVSFPVSIDFNTIDKEILDIRDFFQDGIQATFYLYNYEEDEDLIFEDTFYDTVAYKKSTPTYFYRGGEDFNYKIEDFISERLDQESFAIKYCNHLTTFEDRVLVYGNPRFKNTVFLSEEGSPYYFPLVNSFEFDFEIVHIQNFKTILLVFTSNDIWVIYKEMYKNEFGEILFNWKSKKILYNISTEEKNKASIKNLTRYITLISNNVLYLIKPSTFIGDDTEFSLTVLSQAIEPILKNPIEKINERLFYYGVFKKAESYKMNLRASDNLITIFFNSVVDQNEYTLMLIYDVLNNRWYEEDTCSFGYPQQIYSLDSTVKNEMLTNLNGEIQMTFQTDKYSNLMLNEYGESYYDLNKNKDFDIKYFIDTGYMKLSDHLRKRFKHLQINIKNIDSKTILFNYDFTVDDIQFETPLEISYTTNDSSEIIEVTTIKQIELKIKEMKLNVSKTLIEKRVIEEIKQINELISKDDEMSLELKRKLISNIGTFDSFLLDFSNLETGDIMTVRNNLLGRGRLPRLKMSFSAKNKFYILAFGITYTELGGI
jgi:hypothetical protein